MLRSAAVELQIETTPALFNEGREKCKLRIWMGKCFMQDFKRYHKHLETLKGESCLSLYSLCPLSPSTLLLCFLFRKLTSVPLVVLVVLCASAVFLCLSLTKNFVRATLIMCVCILINDCVTYSVRRSLTNGRRGACGGKGKRKGKGLHVTRDKVYNKRWGKNE